MNLFFLCFFFFSFQKFHNFASDATLPWSPLLGALSCCHSLVLIDGKLQGDPLDIKMFEGTQWVRMFFPYRFIWFLNKLKETHVQTVVAEQL